MAAGTAMPPAAATTGRAAARQVRSSPTTSSRLISSPTTRKNRAAAAATISTTPPAASWRRYSRTGSGSRIGGGTSGRGSLTVALYLAAASLAVHVGRGLVAARGDLPGLPALIHGQRRGRGR